MISRRAFVTGLGAVATTTGLAVATGCSSSPGQAPTAGPTVTSSAPVTVRHVHGSTVVPASPERVVSVGVTEQDPLLALGVVPVGVTEWYGDQPFATWPWARDELGPAQPTVLSTGDGFQLEKIAALRPDLIIGTNAGIEKSDYAKLAAIAPTVAHSGTFKSAYFEPWPVQTQLIGDAVGKPAEAAALIAEVRGRFTQAKQAHAEFAGKKAIFLQGAFYEGAAIASPAGLATDFLTDLGFDVPPEIEPFIKEGAQAYIPLERLDVLDVADVLVWGTDDAPGARDRDKNPVYQRLSAVRAGRSVDTGAELAGAIYFTSVLSLPYVVDTLVPMLAKALRA